MRSTSSSGAVCSWAVERMPCSSRPPASFFPRNDAPILAMIPSNASESVIAVNSRSSSAGLAFSSRRRFRSVALAGSLSKRWRAIPLTRFLAESVQCGSLSLPMIRASASCAASAATWSARPCPSSVKGLCAAERMLDSANGSRTKTGPKSGAAMLGRRPRQLAFRVEHDRRSGVAEKVRDQDGRRFAGSGTGNRHHMAVVIATDQPSVPFAKQGRAGLPCPRLTQLPRVSPDRCRSGFRTIVFAGPSRRKFG